MSIRLVLNGVDPEDVTALRRLIQADRELAGTRLSPEAASSGEMGANLELLNVALGPDGTGVALAGVLVAWIRSRVRRVSVKVETKQGVVEMSTTNVKDASVVAKNLAKALDKK